MSEMIERVARAIGAADPEQGGQINDSEMGDYFWEKYRHLYLPMARAAIEAMREPTKMMLNSTADVVVYYDDFALNDGTCYMSEDSAEQAFKSMIDAALKEKP